MKGKFITFEGPDGCGKTTIVEMIYKKLEDLGYKVIKTREPGGTDISEKIRDVILDVNNDEMSPRCEALLYAASRAQHTEEKIIPYLNKGYIVLCERYILSSYAYQGYGRGLLEGVVAINDFATSGLRPDLTILLMGDYRVGLERKNEMGADRLELESTDFHKKVYKGYEEIAKYEDVTVIDANSELETVFNNTLEKILEMIE
ncbi:dTMP kinase [Peptoniphilus sp.]|uniref:dTMP kinase n=1 Tax=Peptoniphilus sp. TaxID=1971214 RepID=UPI0039911ECD